MTIMLQHLKSMKPPLTTQEKEAYFCNQEEILMKLSADIEKIQSMETIWQIKNFVIRGRISQYLEETCL